ncbi:MAG: DUF3883 domain-containing protein [Gemmatimonadaceae bacterium]
MAEDWSLEEVAATIADYFAMLELELRGESYNKKDHNRRLQSVLHGRSAGAIEFKHANISAVLLELGFPYIDGYKPRANYQELLKDEVSERLGLDARLNGASAELVEAPAPGIESVRPLADILVPVPVRVRTAGYERRQLPAVLRRGVDYLAIEARNASLGRAGEVFALEVEHRRLWEAGRRELAQRIEHVSQTQGVGLGYDISSFEIDGRERLIEVKTTAFGSMTPFYASATEVAVSDRRAHHFSLYRVFKFRESPRLFILTGSLRISTILDPIQFRASVP